MKVLVQCYDTAFQNMAGGVHSRIERTVSALKSEGIQAEYFDKFRTNVTDYDILHVFKLDVGSLGLMRYAKSKGLKIVLSSIVTLEKPYVVDFYYYVRKIPIMTTYKLLFQMCEISDAVITETKREAEFMEKHYRVSAEKIKVIPDGVDVNVSDSMKIYDILGKKCDYVLEVARFDENKNQLNVIKALKNSPIEVVFIGGADGINKDYYDKCLREADGAENIQFLGWQDSKSEILQSAYANAKVVIVPSYHETFGLSLVEGIMAGANIVASGTLPILEYDALRGCITCNPSDVRDIRNKVEMAGSKDSDMKMIDEVRKTFSWKTVAESHKQLYERIL